MYRNSVAKGSKRNRQPLKRLPKTYDNAMPLQSDGPPPLHSLVTFNNTAMNSISRSYSATTSALPYDNNVAPSISFTHSPPETEDQTRQAVGEKRLKTDLGYSVSPGTVLAGNEEDVLTLNEQGRKSVAAVTFNNPESLALPEDKQHLTELHCFVRRHNVYLFCADADEVSVPKKGRKKSLTIGQVGIGCLHCRYRDAKLKSSTYFPSSISGIYNATMIIQQRHFPVCPFVSEQIQSEYSKLKVLTARSASTKEYWVYAAQKLGLIDTKEGVFFRSNLNQKTTIMLTPTQVSPGSLSSLVEPSDKVFATEYAFYVLSQMTTCYFTESDRLGKRKRHVVGFPGLACRYCYGGNGSGRFFPLTLKTFSDVSKSLHVLSNHLQKCPKCPHEMSEHVRSLAENHEVEKVSQPFGTQKIFFDLIWKRLHPELYEEVSTASLGREKSPSSLKSEEYSSPPNDLVQTSDQFQLPPANTDHVERKTSVLYKDVEQEPHKCLIPKKRYCMQTHEKKVDSPEISPSVPPPLLPMQSTNPAKYSETDVSAAMILARGFDRKNKTQSSITIEKL